jgi:hypothetical protein
MSMIDVERAAGLEAADAETSSAWRHQSSILADTASTFSADQDLGKAMKPSAVVGHGRRIRPVSPVSTSNSRKVSRLAPPLAASLPSRLQRHGCSVKVDQWALSSIGLEP